MLRAIGSHLEVAAAATDHAEPQRAPAADVVVAPPLLAFEDGSPVASAAGWPRRRRELYDAIIPCEYGGMPPPPDRVEVTARGHGNERGSGIKVWPGASHRVHEVRCSFPEGEISLTLSVWIPPGDGPFPVLLDIDGSWRYFDDSVVQSVLARGNIAASVDRTEAADDNKDTYRASGLYRLFPAAEFGGCAAWAWAVHRAVDALVSMPLVSADSIAITGHSRGGKAALLAGATDERVAITNPNNSGVGGGGLNRLKMAGAEEIASFWDQATVADPQRPRGGEPASIFWFGAGWAGHRGRDEELPFDNHYLHALVAPRGLLFTEAYEDWGANPASTYAGAQAARGVYEVLGEPRGIGWAFREGGHHHSQHDVRLVLSTRTHVLLLVSY
jgi:hypothetical protein